MKTLGTSWSGFVLQPFTLKDSPYHTCVLILEHGWVELDGEIIDPTLPEADMPYFPGLRFVGKAGLEEAENPWDVGVRQFAADLLSLRLGRSGLSAVKRCSDRSGEVRLWRIKLRESDLAVP